MRRRHGPLTLAVALTVGAASPVAATAAPPDAPSTQDSTAQPVGSATVTLITGDRVRLDVMDDGTQRATVVAPAGTGT